MVQETAQLKQTALDEILANARLQTKLQLAFGKSYFSIRRWAQTGNVILTTVTALQIISEETGIPQNELIGE
ncbi:hypothetical protein [Mucilaginibacter sp.]|jgi:hypothetical protein|uniref:hypothetical protein n=1 Tax=Mucilaginibacter sp. TaxID=1882438 RepID=UPI003566B70B